MDNNIQSSHEKPQDSIEILDNGLELNDIVSFSGITDGQCTCRTVCNGCHSICQGCSS
jgi:hypothetical protein